MHNYNPAYIEGSKNLHPSSFKEHAASNMHSRAMLLLKRAQSSDKLDFSRITKALHTMDVTSEQQIKRKFDIAFMIAKEHMAFTKRSQWSQPGPELQVCAIFIEYTIALGRRKILVEVLSLAKQGLTIDNGRAYKVCHKGVCMA